MSLEQFWLRWNNQADILSTLGHLLTSEAFVDVSLFAEGRVLKAHRIILSACSPYFENLFNSLPNLHPAVVLRDVKFNTLKAILDFVYRGEVFVDQNDITDVLKAAEALKIKGLVDVVWNDAAPLNIVHVVTPKAAKTPPSAKRKKSGASSPRNSCDSAPPMEQVENTEEMLATNEEELKPHQDLIVLSESVRIDEERNTDAEELAVMDSKVTPISISTTSTTASTGSSDNEKSTIMILESPAVSVSCVPTVIVHRRPQRQYTKEDMRQALELVRQGQMGIKPAARAFNIPVATLHHAARRSNIISPLQQGGRSTHVKRINLGDLSSKLFAEPPPVFVQPPPIQAEFVEQSHDQPAYVEQTSDHQEYVEQTPVQPEFVTTPPVQQEFVTPE